MRNRAPSLSLLAPLACGLVWGLAGTPAPAADRVVFAQSFTATWCTHCPIVGRAMDNLMTDYPDSFLAIQIHSLDDYETPFGDTLASFYQVFSLPDTWFDGTDQMSGDFGSDDQNNYDGFLAMYQARVDLPTPILLDLSVTPAGGQTYTVNVDVELESSADPMRVNVYVADCLYGYPDYPDNRAHNTLRQGFEIQSVDLTPGQTATVQQDVTFDGTSWANQDDIRILAWVQEPALEPPAEVYQSASIAYPFGGTDCPGDVDGDGDVDQSDLGLLLAAYEIDGGGDLDGDGDTDQSDLGILLANYEIPC
jgi:thiol-disulfide isomerase/thioredoxin